MDIKPDDGVSNNITDPTSQDILLESDLLRTCKDLGARGFMSTSEFNTWWASLPPLTRRTLENAFDKVLSLIRAADETCDSAGSEPS